MKQAEILTIFVGTGAVNDPYRAALWDDYVVSGEDVTGISSENLIPITNLYSVRVRMEDAVLVSIEADNNYYVMWSEDYGTSIP